jgi:hypothetical protein
MATRRAGLALSVIRAYGSILPRLQPQQAQSRARPQARGREAGNGEARGKGRRSRAQLPAGSACCGVAFVWCGGTPPVWGRGLTRGATSSTGKHTLKTLQQTLPKIIRRAAWAVVIFFETSGAREEGDRLSSNSCGSLALPSGGHGAAPLLLELHAPWLVGPAG